MKETSLQGANKKHIIFFNIRTKQIIKMREYDEFNSLCWFRLRSNVIEAGD